MTYDVIVVGSGIAGLTAAQSLTSLGRKVGLFEANNRLGGRILATESSQGITINLGASTLQASDKAAHPLIPLLKSHNIKTENLDPNRSESFDSAGNRISMAKLHQSLGPEYDESMRLVQLAKESATIPYPSLSQVFMYDKHSDLEKDSQAYWARKFITASIEQHTGASINEVSLLELMQNDDSLSEKEMLLLPASKIVDAIVQEANATANLTIHLNSALHKVRCIEENDESTFELIFKNGERYKTKAVILALPFSILKLEKIEFDPPLSEPKRKAFKHFGISYYNSVFLEFESIFWEKDAHYLYPNGTKIEDWPQYLNMAAFSDKTFPGLILQCYGKKAQFGKKPDEEVVEEALKPLKHVYGNKISALKSFAVSRFDTDPNILGGSLYYSKSSTAEDLDALLFYETKGLYFAGDYLHPKKHGTLEAASLSGLEASWQVDAFLRYKAYLQKAKESKPSRKHS